MHERVVAPGEGTRASAESAESAESSESSESSSATSLVVSALSDLNVALRIDPSDVKALRLRARARRALGDGRRADEDDAAVARAEAEAARKEKQKLEAAGDLFVDDSGLVCVVCIDAPRDTRLMPCEHSALCGDCAKECRNRQGSCPICNTRIKAIEWGSFLRTFAPAEAKMHLARLASAVKKAKEQDDVSLESESEDSDGSSLGDSQALAGSESSTRTMPTLTPVSFESAYSRRLEREDTAGAPRPGTPERDFSEYTVGSGMEDDLEMPTTPVGNRSSGVFGDVAGFGLTSSPTPMGAIGGALARAEEEAEEDVEGPDTPPRE
jgi:hypothetical protein